MSTQTTLAFDTDVRRPRARTGDPETSQEAAQSVERLTEKQEFILDTIKRAGPTTDEDIWGYLNIYVWVDTNQKERISPSGARTRRKELTDKNLVRDSGKRRKTRSGRNAIVWEAV